MIKFIDLFAGIGGIRRGVVNALNRHGIESRCVLSSEIDERACETYELNYHEHPQGDVRQITEVEPFDLVLAGFPCQPFSYAGKRQGFGDTRGTLFFEVERLIEAYRPKAFLLENVRGLYTHDEGRTFQTIIDHLHALGYGTYDLLLNSSDFGVPQNRVRLYILGIRDAQPNMTLVTNLGAADSHAYRRQGPVYGRRRAVVADILEDNVDPKYICSDRFQEMLHHAIGDDLSILHGWRMMDYRGGQSVHSWDMGMRGECSDAEKRFMTLLIQNRRHPEFGRHQDGKKLTMEQIRTFYHDDDVEDVAASLIAKGYLKEEDGRYNPVCGNMSFEVFKYLDPQSISITLTSSDCNRLGVIQNNQARHITPRECARLQGFPDDFIVNPNDKFAYKQFGNSVSVPVIEAVFNDFLEHNLEQLGWLNEVHPAQAVPNIVEAKITKKPQYKQLNFLDLFDQYGFGNITVNEDEAEYGHHKIDFSQNVLVSYVKKDNFEQFLDGTAKIYYTGKKFPSTVLLNKLYYFMPYLSGKGVRDLYYIKAARLGCRKEGQVDEDKNDLRLVFEIERVGQFFDDYKKVKLEIWRAFTDTTMSEISKLK